MDATEPLSISRRPSSRGSRPQNAPMGPRTRVASRNSLLPADMSRAGSRHNSTIYNSAPSPRYSTPVPTEPSDSKALDAITEGEYESSPAANRPSSPSPAYVPEEPLNITSTIPKKPTLTPPPQIKFEAPQVKWKGLPLEAALWTFDSKELQELVSRAIRGSSRESFIRILSVENLDRSLPEELERLNALKSITQSKYRFTVHRRTMQLQALHTFSSYNDRDRDTELIAKLTSQLSQTTAECDQLLEDLFQITDQVAQINRLLDNHWASALAVALRKLNSSYGRRTSELLSARDRIAALEAELNDAWQQAEKLAQEMDELEAAASDDEDAVISIAEVISLNHRKSPSFSSQFSLGRLEDVPSLDAISRMHSELSQTTSSAQSPLSAASPASAASPVDSPEMPASPVVEHTVRLSLITDLPVTPEVPPSPSQIKLPSPTLSEFELTAFDTPISPSIVLPIPETSDAASIRSVRSARSAKSAKSARTTRSQRTTEGSRLSIVSAARRRSLRTSMSSLRMPNPAKTRKGSHPPVPSLPSSVSPVTPNRNSVVGSFLDFGLRDTDESDDADAGESAVPSPRRTSIEEIEVVAHSPAAVIHTRDDIHIMPSRSAAENEVMPRRSQFSLDHQHPFANEVPVNNHAIPSIWLLNETPKTPAERVEMMQNPGHTKMGSFQRLKSLTKRYSLPFQGLPTSNTSRSSTRSKSSKNILHSAFL